MKLQLLHGPGLISSRSKLQLIKRQFNPSNVVVFGPEANLQEVLGMLVTPSLFADPGLIILENPPENLTLGSSFIIYPSSLVLWFDREISSKSPVLESIKKYNGEVLFFDASKETSVFPFLDNLAYKDQRAFLELHKLKAAGFDVFYILTMVFYLLRSLIFIAENAPEFVKKKLAKQRMNFELVDISNLYEDILEIEFKLKKGLLDTPEAEFLIAGKFVKPFCHYL